MREVLAGLVSRICSSHPRPVSVSREQSACLARLGFLPIFPLCQTEEEGSREEESSGKLPRGEGGQQRKQEKYIFLSLLSPSKALYSLSFCVSTFAVFSTSIPPASHFVLLSPKPLILLLLPHTRSLILNLFFPLYQPFSIVLHVPLCYPPPPFSPLCLSHLNMPPLTITLSHTQDDCSTPYFLSFISSTFFFCFFPCCFLCYHPHIPFFYLYISAQRVFSSRCLLSSLVPDLNVTFVTITTNGKN